MVISTIMPSNIMNFTENQHASIVLEKLWSQREAGRFCDVVLHVEGQKFLAHRNVLASCSPFFDSVLKTRKVVKEQLTITCQNIDAFQLLLNYMYTGAIIIDKNTVAEILRLANHFLVTKLKNYCAEYLDRYLDVSNCFSVKDMAEKYNLPILLKNTTTFIHNHIVEVLQQNEILEFPFPKLETFLSDKQYQIPQPTLFSLICKWIEHDFDNRECNFHTVLSFVNWDQVEQQYWNDQLKTDTLFKKNLKCLYLVLQCLKKHKIDLPEFNEIFASLKDQYGLSELDAKIDKPNDVPKSTSVENSKAFSVELSEENAPITVAPLEKEPPKENHSAVFESEQLVKVCYSDTSNSSYFDAVPDLAVNDDYDDTQSSEEEKESASLNGQKDSTSKSNAGSCATPIRKSDRIKKTVPPLKISRKLSGKISATPVAKSKVKNLKRKSKPVTKDVLYDNLIPKVSSVKSKKKYVSETDTDDDDDNEDDGCSSATDSSNQEESLNGYGNKLKWKDGVKCPHCSYIAHSSVRLEQHVSRIHAKDVTYKCKVCEFTCKWNREYYMHMKTHFQGPPFRCENCEYTCDRIQFLLSHQMRHTDERPFKCDECDHRCRTKANLDCHMRCHTGEKPYQCEHCERRFAIKASLDQHLASHREDRPFLCDTCGFSTKYQSHLFSHKRIHTGDVFHCQFPNCTYSTPKKSQLGSHHRTHTAVRSHICAICGRAFIEKSHLVRHERIHLNEKPFKCEQCDYSSSRRDKLKEHFRKHHGENATAKGPYRPRKPRRLLATEAGSYSPSHKNLSVDSAENQLHPLIELASAVTSVSNNATPVVYTYESSHQDNLHTHAVTLQQLDAAAHNYQVAFMEQRHHQPAHHHHHHLQHPHLTHGHPHVGPAPPLAVPAMMTDQNRVVAVTTHDGTNVVAPSSDFSPYMSFM